MASMKYSLFYMDQKIPLEPGSICTIGRDKKNSIQLPGKIISREHARIFWEDGHFVIEDLNSRNGLFVNGQKSDRHTLFDTDHIVIGTFFIIYKEYESGDSCDAENENAITDTLLLECRMAELLKIINDSAVREKLLDIKHIMNNIKARLDRLANRDRLTKLYNRRHFDEELKKEFERSARYDYSISLFMIDIDDFKKINDTYGHQKGDLVLSAVSAIISENTRLNDIVARYGGEEIVVVIPEMSSDNSMNIAEKIRNRIEKLIPARTGINVTVSIGGASNKKNDTTESLIKKADRALYEAKKRGKNRVVIYNANA